MISSRNNPAIKNIVSLSKAAERRSQNLIIVEGFREIDRALKAGFVMKQLYFCPEVGSNELISKLNKLLSSNVEVVEVSSGVFEKIAYREGSDGLLALFEPKNISLDDLQPKSNPLLIVLESVEKPGNLGAVMRTADAASADAVIVCDPRTDLYNPNTIRSSLGCIFTVPVVACTTTEAIKWLNSHKIDIFATSLEASIPYTECNFKGPSAIVMGTEATGLTPQWLQHSKQNLIIPMKGIADSLNISVSAAIVVFEALRQRLKPINK